jgi:hypothetical protein
MARVRLPLNLNGKHFSIKLQGSDLRDYRTLINNLVEKTPYIPMNSISEHISVKFTGSKMYYVCVNISLMEAR